MYKQGTWSFVKRFLSATHWVVDSAAVTDIYLPRVMNCQVRYKQKNKQQYKAPHVAKQRMRMSSSKKLLAPFQNTQDPSDECFWMTEPVDDVWIRENYPIQQHSLVEAITRHKQYAQPQMFNTIDSTVLFADVSLNMATAKKTKFVKPIKETILLPHRFSYKEPNRCIVFCQLEEDMNIALEHGAIYAGADKLLRMVEDDVLTKEDYDFVLATPDMVTKLVSARSKLRDHYPQEKNGTMSDDVALMVTHFMHGVTVESQVTLSESVNRLQLPIGQLKMSTDELVENFRFYIETLGKRRAVKATGAMVLQAFVIAPPSPETFFLLESEYQFSKPKAMTGRKGEVEEENEEIVDELEKQTA